MSSKGERSLENVDPTAMPPMRFLATTYNEMVKDFVAGGFSRREAMQFALEHFRLAMQQGFDKGEDGED